MARLALKLLGAMQVTLDGHRIEGIESDKARLLLAYLAFENARPQTREALAELLWPEQPEGRARHNLSQALYNLRLALGDHSPTGTLAPEEPYKGSEPYLLVTHHSLQFNPKTDHTLDTAHFHHLLGGCGAHQPNARSSCQACMGCYREAVALYRGDFLADFYLKDCLAIEEWMALTREHLRQQLLHALDYLADFHDRRGEFEQAIDYAHRQVELDPLGETVRRTLMRLLAQDGLHSAALAQYEDFKRLLLAELGAEPERETSLLCERLSLESDSAAPLGDLPEALTPFIGRQSELLELGDMLRDPACRLITVLGPGGAGKTRLALETVRPLHYHFTHGVYLVLLSALESPAGLLPAIAKALGYHMREGEDPKHQLCAYLGSRRVLLLLDSFETVLGAAPLMAELLRLSPGSKALVTTRARLGLKTEQVFHLVGMDYPAPDQVYDPQDFSAVELFLSAARRVFPGFSPSEEDNCHITRICELVEGMPLGVLLASVWVDQFTPAEIARRIERSLDFLSVDWGDVPQRQRSLRATFDYSWDLLTEQERAALAGLSVFCASFTREAARQVASAGRHELRALVAKSMLGMTPEGRCQMHDLVRQFAEGKLAEVPQHEGDVRERHSAYYLEVAQSWEADLMSARQAEALKEIDLEYEDLHTALRCAAANGHYQRLEGGLEATCLYLDLRMRLQEGASLCRLLVEIPGQAAYTGEGRRLLAHLLTWEAHFDYMEGERDQAHQRLEEAHLILEELQGRDVDVRRVFAQWWFEVGLLEDNLSTWQEAHYCSANLYRELEQPWWLARVLHLIGGVYSRLGDETSARQEILESIALCRAIGEPRQLAYALEYLAYSLISSGEFDDALATMQEAADCFYSIGDPYNAALGSLHLGTMYMWHGRNQEACRLLEQSLPIFQEVRYSFGQTFGCLGMAIAMLNLGKYPQAQRYLQSSLNSARDHGYRRESAGGHAIMAALALQEGDPERGLSLASKAIRLYHEMGYRGGELGIALGCLALVYNHLDDTREAHTTLREALMVVKETHNLGSLLWALPASVLLLMELGYPQKALETYTALTQIPTYRRSRWIEDLLGEHIRSLKDSLPPEVLEAAQRRGGIIDPNDLAAELLELFTSTSMDP